MISQMLFILQKKKTFHAKPDSMHFSMTQTYIHTYTQREKISRHCHSVQMCLTITKKT